jgi:O-antigen ligase
MLEVGRIWGMDIEHLLPVHNVYLYIWAELGLPGLALFLLGCFSILKRLRSRLSANMLLWLCCFLAICGVMIFDNYWWAVHPFRVVFLCVVGLWWGYTSREAAPITASVAAPTTNSENT